MTKSFWDNKNANTPVPPLVGHCWAILHFLILLAVTIPDNLVIKICVN